MKEAVLTPKYPWLAGIAFAGLAAAYFFLLGTSDFEQPGANIEYNLEGFEELDKIETQYQELPPITLGVKDARALAAAQGKLYVGALDAIAVHEESGKEIARHAIKGTPRCLAVAPDGTIYAGMHATVLVLDPSGAKKAEWTDFSARSYITAIAVSGADIYVADAGDRVVLRYDAAGTRLTRIGEKDESRDVPGIEAPSPYLDLAINPDGDLWVVNPGKLGLERYRSDGSIVTAWYKPSVLKLDGFPGCCNPTHIAFNSNGQLLTCEKGLPRVKAFEVTAGTFDGLVAGSALFPQEQSLHDLAVDSKDRILLLDGKKNSVRVFTRKEAPDGPTSQPQ
jgi:sugar lactone lactonase YvrE